MPLLCNTDAINESNECAKKLLAGCLLSWSHILEQPCTTF